MGIFERTVLTLSEQELRLIEQLNLLEEDPALRHIRTVLIECLDIFLDRAGKYNNGSDFYEHNFSLGDFSALINLRQAFTRTEDIVKSHNDYKTEAPINDTLPDVINWAISWSCCRIEKKGKIRLSAPERVIEACEHKDSSMD